MKKHFQRSKRFFVAVISMLLIFNQLSVLTPELAFGADLGSETVESSSDDLGYENTDAQGQLAETEASAETAEVAETVIDSADEEAEIEAKGSSQKTEGETAQAEDGSALETAGESVSPDEISAAEDEDEEVQVERGPPAEVQDVTEEETGGSRAVKTKTVLTFTSDIHNSSNNTAANRLNTWLGNVIDMYGGIDLMSFCGDMGAASAGESEFWSYTQAVMDVVEGQNIPDVYTTGNHEFYNGKFDSTSNALKQTYIVGEEAVNESNYRIYCLGTDNWNNSSDNYTSGQISALSNYLGSVGTDKPIIILTHFPLHYFSSGGGGGWGGYGGGRQTANADQVIDTLNDAAAEGKTIIFLWGHNHTVSDEHYDEMYEPGSTIEYKSGSTKTFNFYYGAAGCMSDSEYGSGSAFVKGKGLVIAIDNDKNITFAYYDANGNNVTEAGSGGDTPSGGGDDDENGEGVTPESGKKYVILASDGYALTSEGEETGYTNGSSGSEQYNYNGLTGEEYTVGEAVAPDRLMWTFTASEDGKGFYIQSQDGRYLNGTYVSNSTGGYDGTLKLDETPDVWIITGASSGSTVNAHILKSSNASQSDAGDKYLTHGNGDSSVSNIFTLRSESNATSTIFYEYTDDGTFVEPDPDNPTPTGTIRYEETDHFEAGKEYIVAVTKDDSSVYAISKSSSSVSAATLDVTAASGDTPAYITTKDSNVLWTYDSSSYLKNGSDYFYPTSNNGIMTYTSGRVISYTDGKLSYETSSSGTYYVTCSSGSFGTSNQASEGASFRLFVKTQGTTPDNPDDPDDPTPTKGSVYKLVDSFTSGQEYLIVSSDSAGSAYALTNPGGSSNGANMGSSSVTIQSGDVDADGTSDIYISADASDIVWKAAANGSGFNLTNGSDSLEGKGGNVKIYSSVQYADRYWTYTDHQLKHNGGQNSYTVYYSDGFTSSYNSSSNKIYIYQKVEGGSVIPDDPTPTEGDRYEETNKLEDGKEYILAVTKDDGSVYAVNNTGGSEASVITLDVTAANGDDPAYIVTKEQGVAWEYTASDRYLSNGGKYFYPSSNGVIRTYSSGRAMNYADGELSFDTSSSGTYYVTFADGAFNTTNNKEEAGAIRLFVKAEGDSPDDPTPTEGGIYKLTDKLVTGKEYLIVSSDTAGSAYALTNPGGTSSGASMGRTAVTILNGDIDEDGTSDIYISAEATSIIWNAAANGNGFNLTNGSDSLEGKGGDVKIYNSVQYADRYWTYTDSQLQHVGGQNTYTVYYDSSFKATYDSNSNKIYIYEKVKEGSDIPDDPTPTDGTNYKLTDKFTSGNEYLIVSADSAGSAYAVANPGGTSDGASVKSTAVTIQSGDVDADGTSDLYISTDAADVVWTAATSKNGFTITNNGDYLEGASGNVKVFNPQKYSDRYWTYNNSYMLFEGGSYTYEFYYSDGFTSRSFNSGDPSHPIYIYEKVESSTHVHNWGEGVITKEASCTESGEKTYTCSGCGETKTEEIPALNHDLQHHDAKAATCKEEGNIEYWTCSRCGKFFSDEEGKTEITQADTVTAKTDHSWDEGVITKAATCAEAGVKTYTCRICGETRTEEIPALSHDLQHHDAKAATCKEEGNIEYWTCSHCGKIFSDGEGKTEITQADTIIAKTDHSWNDGVITKYATCTEAGQKVCTCSICGETRTEDIPALGHKWEFKSFAWVQNEGFYSAIVYYMCENNPAHQEYIIPEVTVEIERPTCTESGKITYTALISGEAALDGISMRYVREEPIQPLGHKYGEPTYEWAEDNSSVTAEMVCENDETHVVTETVDTTVVVTDATCEEAGSKVYTAEFENDAFETQTKTEEIPAIEHDWKFESFKWSKTEDGYSGAASYICRNNAEHKRSVDADVTCEKTEPTCTEEGILIYTAVISEEAALDDTPREYVRESVLAPLGHNFGEPVWNWNEFESAAATFTCANDASHTETVNADITTAQGTGEDEGYTVYTASVVFENKTYTDKKRVINQYTLTFMDGDEEYAVITQDYGTEIVPPADPVKEGLKFAGWAPEVPKTMPAKDMTLTAQWLAPSYELDITSIENLPTGQSKQLNLVGDDGLIGKGTWTSSDESVATVDENGLVTAVRYGKAVIHVEMEDGYKADCTVQTRFWDVAGPSSEQYFYDAVYWAADFTPKAITKGFDLKYFGVGEACQRQDFILFIYRLAGEPSVSASEVNAVSKTFSDVSGLSESFKKAIAWGSKQGIIKGYTSGPNKGKFGNGFEITRKEAMIMLWRYNGKPAPSAKGLSAVKTFTDVEGKVSASSDTYKSIAWAAGKGITNGYKVQDDTLTEHGYTVPCFGIDLPCMREQMIVFLYRSAK